MLLSPINHTMPYPFGHLSQPCTISGNNVMMPHIWPEFRAYRDIAPWLQKLSTDELHLVDRTVQVETLCTLRSSGGSISCAQTFAFSPNHGSSKQPKPLPDGACKWMPLGRQHDLHTLSENETVVKHVATRPRVANIEAGSQSERVGLRTKAGSTSRSLPWVRTGGCESGESFFFFFEARHSKAVTVHGFCQVKMCYSFVKAALPIRKDASCKHQV